MQRTSRRSVPTGWRTFCSRLFRAKRRLRLELAVQSEGSAGVAAEVRKRLPTIAKSRSFVDRQKFRAFVQDIAAQRRAIVNHVAPGRPAEAFDVLWRLLDMAPPIYERCDDAPVFRQLQLTPAAPCNMDATWRMLKAG